LRAHFSVAGDDAVEVLANRRLAPYGASGRSGSHRSTSLLLLRPRSAASLARCSAISACLRRSSARPRSIRPQNSASAWRGVRPRFRASLSQRWRVSSATPNGPANTPRSSCAATPFIRASSSTDSHVSKLQCWGDSCSHRSFTAVQNDRSVPSGLSRSFTDERLTLVRVPALWLVRSGQSLGAGCCSAAVPLWAARQSFLRGSLSSPLRTPRHRVAHHLVKVGGVTFVEFGGIEDWDAARAFALKFDKAVPQLHPSHLGLPLRYFGEVRAYCIGRQV